MDPFTQRMLERARARQEKIDQKLACSGQTVPKRKPLTENISVIKNASPIRSPSKAKESVLSPRKSLKSESPAKTVTRRPSLQKSQNAVASPQKSRNDVVVTKKEFSSPRGSIGRRNSDVSLEINITHRNDIKVDVQIEEIDAPISVVYNTNSDSDSNVVIKEIEDGSTKMPLEQAPEETEHKMEKAGTRHNFKSRLDRLGNLYSDEPNLSSPIHRTEQDFSAATPPKQQPVREKAPDGKRKFGRLAALADQINNWEDDLTHHTFNPEPVKKTTKAEKKHEKLDASTLDVSIHSFNDINNVLKKTPAKSAQPSKASNTRQSSKPSVNECQRLQRQIIAELEGEGYRRVSAGKSRLVYDFTATENADPARQEPKRASTTPSAAPAPNMAAMVASGPPVAATVTKKPSLKKYRAPTPPSKTQLGDDEDKDKENNAVQAEQESDDASDCIQTKPEPADQKPAAEKGSPAAKRLAPKLNGNVDRSSVLSRAAMFEAGSPRNKDPAEMSLRERKALFEKNKGAAIVPKAPFGMAPSAKTLHGDNKDKAKSQTSAKTTPTKSNISNNSRANSKDSLADDNVSQTSVGGIKGKLAALFSKEQTISETTIANKFKQEREKEMEMLQNRFNYKPPKETPAHDNGDSDDEQSDNDRSEKAPLMGSALNLANAAKKPEIIANVPKVTFDDKTKAQELIDKEAEKEKVVGSQPVKRRSSQDSPVVLSVLEDVKRIKVNSKKEPLTNGLVLQQPGLYPHLSDIETDNSNTQEEFSDCGGSSTDERLNDNLNKSDNWAETSFGREVMNVVKKNNTSYKKAVRESDSDDTHSACDSELDDMLDEALNEDGPTPPKVNKHGSVTSSSSFVYQEKAQFKSPQKPKPPQHPTTPRVDRGNELVHSVSFYRRMQNASSTPTTPMRVVRHGSPEREIPATPDEPAAAVTVRQRVKELQNEIAKQQTVISQASQALNLCASTIEFSGSTEQAEGERLLLLATHRRQACLHEVQRLQVEGAGPAATAGMASLHIHGLSVPLRRDYVRQLNAAHYQACLHEVQRLQVEGAGPAATAGMASLHIHGLSVPLRRDYVRQLNADGAVGHHAVCLLKCRDRVLASSMPRTQPSAALLHFPDEIRMDHLTSDFKVTVEVYLLQASKESLPHDVKYHINNKKSNSKLLTPKSKVSELKAPRVQSPAGPLSVRSPQFQLHGYCIFALQQASRKTFTLNKAPYSRTNMSELKAPRVQSPAGPLSVRSPQFQLHGYCIFALQQASRKTFTLNKVPCGSPLEGSVNIDIKARVRVDAPPPHAAFLTAFDDVSGLGAWHRRWFRLCAPTLAYWKYPDDVTKKLPIGDIDLSTIVSDKVVRAPRDLCARPNTIMLEAAVPAGLIVPDSGSLVYVRRPDGSLVRRHLLAADTPKDRDMWLDCLNKALEYVRCCATDDD